SSISAGFMRAAASFVRWMPTGTEPVNVIARITGESIRNWEISDGLPKTRLTTPSGTPASRKQRTNAYAPPGVSSAAFSTIEQPAASAAPTLRAGELAGEFHGVNPATGP